MYDVIVVGAGPAGSAAAKRCAEYGLHTLILEKKKLPRHKCCSGMIMGPAAHTFIKQEFGEIPREILTDPPHLNGYMFHVPGVGSQKIDKLTPLTWRRDLDYWMNQKAQDKGVEIWQSAELTGLRQEAGYVVIEVKRNREKQEIETRYLIAADGTGSPVRKLLFPDFSVRYRQIYQEGYEGKIDLPRDYFHWFYPLEFKPVGFFTVHHKGSRVFLEYAGWTTQVKGIAQLAKKLLAEKYGFDASLKPSYRIGCLGLRIQGDLISGNLLPAKGKVLLAGDAGGFQLPVGGEGIGSGIENGLLAADSVKEALKTGKEVEGIYLNRIQSMLPVFRDIYPWSQKIVQEAERGGASLPEVLRDAYSSMLRMT